MAGWSGKLVKTVLMIGLLGSALLTAGFVRFAGIVASTNTPQIVQADGIIALTGGAKRLSDAIALLTAGRGAKLLITGVGIDTSDDSLLARLEADQTLATCCIDFDRTALDTIGNAQATGLWARENGFTSLIIVTSAYHIPRSLLEIQSAAPDLELIPYPVVRSQLNLENWYLDMDAMRLLLREYLKYMLVRIRLFLTAR